MAVRNERLRVTSYLPLATYESLVKEAMRDGMSLASYCAQLIHKHLVGRGHTLPDFDGGRGTRQDFFPSATLASAYKRNAAKLSAEAERSLAKAERAERRAKTTTAR